MFNKLKVYIHVAKMNTWEAILSELLEDIRFNGLLARSEVTLVSVGGKIPDIPKLRVIDSELPLSAYEYPTLDLLYNEVEENTAICYCHLKGVSQPNSWPHRSWRRDLSYFTLLDWANRVTQLQHIWTSGPRVSHSGAGSGMDHIPAHKHYSGNFWWARSDYITKLPLPSTLNRNRFGAEAWLGQSPLINESIQ